MSDSRRVAPIGLAVSKENNLTPSLRMDVDYCVDECPLFFQGMPPCRATVRATRPERPNHDGCSGLFAVTPSTIPPGTDDNLIDRGRATSQCRLPTCISEFPDI